MIGERENDGDQDADRLELEQRTIDAIRDAIALGLKEDAARLLCFQTGVKYEDVVSEPRRYTKPLFDQLPDNANPF